MKRNSTTSSVNARKSAPTVSEFFFRPIKTATVLMYCIPLFLAITLAAILIEKQVWLIVALSIIFILNGIWWERVIHRIWKKPD